jgi:adhesin transport system membrane fusion protein
MTTNTHLQAEVVNSSWLLQIYKHLTGTRLLLIGLLSFLIWANLSQMDQTVRSIGLVIPVARNQIIQAAEGGVLTHILVMEGQEVHAGQPVAMLEATRSKGSYHEALAKLGALQAALSRAKAKSTDKALNFANQSNSTFISGQEQVYRQKRQGLQDEINVLNAALQLYEEELGMNQLLIKTGDVSQLELMRAQRQVQEMSGRIAGIRHKYLQEAKQDVVRIEEEISGQPFKIQERRNLLDHAVLTSPVDGVVKVLRLNTVGGVLRSGDELMHISPSQGGHVIEAKINPSDIGELRIGLPVTLKIDAFDYSVYGVLHGTLSYISSDTLSENSPTGTAQTYYRIQVQLNPIKEGELHSVTAGSSPTSVRSSHHLNSNDLKPGMTATLDIRTRSRSVMQYLAKPVQKAFAGALHER